MFTTRPEIVGTFVVASTHWLATTAGMVTRHDRTRGEE